MLSGLEKALPLNCFKTTCLKNCAVGPRHESFPDNTYYLNQALLDFQFLP